MKYSALSSFTRIMFTGISFALLSLMTLPTRAHDGNPDNKLVEFWQQGPWEIWCLDLGGKGPVICNLNNVLVYRPHPGFRAAIPRIYVEKDGSPKIELGVEWQTTLGKSYFRRENGNEIISLADCSRPCVLTGEKALQLNNFFAEGGGAIWHFTDYLIEDIDIRIDLTDFHAGWTKLQELQMKYIKS